MAAVVLQALSEPNPTPLHDHPEPVGSRDYDPKSHWCSPNEGQQYTYDRDARKNVGRLAGHCQPKTSAPIVAITDKDLEIEVRPSYGGGHMMVVSGQSLPPVRSAGPARPLVRAMVTYGRVRPEPTASAAPQAAGPDGTGEKTRELAANARCGSRS